jgi:hypothetical protein
MSWVAGWVFYPFSCEQLFNFDTDESVLKPSEYINHEFETQWPCSYFARNHDAYALNYEDDKVLINLNAPLGDTIDCNPDLIINSICECMADYGKWISRVPIGKQMVLQNSDMFGVAGNVNCCTSLAEFIAECQLSNVKYAAELDFGDGWKRFLIIGNR